MTPHDDLAARLTEEAERAAPHTPFDVDSLVRRSRVRRRPALLGAGVLATVVIVGIGGLGVGALSGLVPNDLTAADSASLAEEPAMEQGGAGDTGGGTMADGDSALAPDWLQNRCGSSPLTPADVPDIGLRLEVDFPAVAPTGTGVISGTVRITNTGEEPVSALISATPAITLASQGVTVWHTSVRSDRGAEAIALDPGDSRSFEAELRPLACTTDDEGRAVDAELDPLRPGDYAVSAILDITLDDDPAARVPLVSEPEPLQLTEPTG